MSTTILAIHNALADLLTGDPNFLSDLGVLTLGNGGAVAYPQVLRAFRDPRQIDSARLPLFLLESGDSDAQAVTNDGSMFGVVGFTQQDMACDVLIGVIWHQQDHDTAYAQRLRLETAFIDLLLRHPDVGGAVTAWVNKVQFDRGALHPTQTAVITVRVEYVQARIDREISGGGES